MRESINDIKKAVVDLRIILLASLIVYSAFYYLGEGTSAELFFGLAIEIVGAVAILVMFKLAGESDSDKITELQKELAEVKALLIQQNTPTESD